jgi:hypothetical protein
MFVRWWTIKAGIEGVLNVRSVTRRAALLAPLPTSGVMFILSLFNYGPEKMPSLAPFCFLGPALLFFVCWLLNAIVTQFLINWLLYRRYRRGEPLSEGELTARLRREVLWYWRLHGFLFFLRGARWRQVLDAVAPLPGDGGEKGLC